MANRELLTRQQFQIFYGPRKSAFYNLLKSGALQAVKVGSRTYVRHEDAEAWKAGLPAYKPQVQK